VGRAGATGVVIRIRPTPATPLVRLGREVLAPSSARLDSGGSATRGRAYRQGPGGPRSAGSRGAQADADRVPPGVPERTQKGRLAGCPKGPRRGGSRGARTGPRRGASRGAWKGSNEVPLAGPWPTGQAPLGVTRRPTNGRPSGRPLRARDGVHRGVRTDPVLLITRRLGGPIPGRLRRPRTPRNRTSCGGHFASPGRPFQGVIRGPSGGHRRVPANRPDGARTTSRDASESPIAAGLASSRFHDIA
jgi:hypothetical protein